MSARAVAGTTAGGAGSAVSPSFVARQPIYDARLDVYAYELLFRSGDVDHADHDDGNAATAGTVVAAFADIGLDQLVAGRCAFVNATRDFVTRGFVSLLPAGRIALELHADEASDPAVLDELERLAGQGYLVAVHGVTEPERAAELLQVAHFVKIDVRSLMRKEIAHQVRQLARHKVRLIAEKIEDHETFEFCRQIGFDYFQGYVFCQPKTVTGRGIPANRLTQMRLISVLEDPQSGADELEQAISLDLGVSFRLLKWINSPYFSLPRKVDSVREALRLLGEKNVRSWALLVTLAGMDDQPSELARTGMIRAKMCELVARALDRPGPDAYFTVGLFSVADAQVGMPMDEVLAELPLSPAVSDALRGRTGPLGEVLSWVIAYERGEFHRFAPALGHDTLLRDSYVVALRFADEAGV
jgi:c-di-GMP phosphodiesterase